MGGSTFRCNKCGECVRVSSVTELEYYQDLHKEKCDGDFVSIWIDYDKMSKEEKEKLAKQVLFRHGAIDKIKVIDR